MHIPSWIKWGDTIDYVLAVSVSILAVLMIIGAIHKFRKCNSTPPAPTYDMDSMMAQVGAVQRVMGTACNVMEEVCRSVAEMNKSLPGSVLRSIQGSINPRKGKVAELVTLLKLTSEYDRIIPLGKPVDLIGICDDSIDFIEVKTGNAQLTPMERHIRTLIEAGRVRYIVVQQDIDIIIPHGEEEEVG